MRMRINSKSDAASTSQGRLQDAYLGRVDGQSSRETCQKSWEFSESEIWSFHERIVAHKQLW